MGVSFLVLATFRGKKYMSWNLELKSHNQGNRFETISGIKFNLDPVPAMDRMLNRIN